MNETAPPSSAPRTARLHSTMAEEEPGCPPVWDRAQGKTATGHELRLRWTKVVGPLLGARGQNPTAVGGPVTGQRSSEACDKRRSGAYVGWADPTR